MKEIISMVKSVSVNLIVFLILINIAISINYNSNLINWSHKTNYQKTLPIRIDGSQDFKRKAIEYGWSGNGTTQNPYKIENYRISGDKKGCCLYIGNTSKYFIIRNCILENSSGNNRNHFWNSGLVIHNSKNGLLHNVTIRNNKGSGIYLSRSDFLEIDSNNINHNKYGIFVYRTDDSNFKQNLISANKRSGLYFYHSYRNKLRDNRISLTKNYGSYFLHSNDNYFSLNTFSNNNYSVYLYESSNNHFFQNNFFYNLNLLDKCNNHWDGGYYLGGNYWTVTIKKDNKKGVNQTTKGRDGICDNPRIIPGNDNKDKYPLMNQVDINLDIESCLPDPPLNLTTKQENDNIKLKWNLPDSDGHSYISEYWIYRSTNNNEKFYYYDSIPANNTTYIDKEITEGEEYTYSVSSYNKIGESQKSEESSIKVKSRMEIFSNLYLIMGFLIIIFIVLSLIYKHYKPN